MKLEVNRLASDTRALAGSLKVEPFASGNDIESICRLVWPRVRDICRRRLANRADADDAAQEVILKVFSRAAQFDATYDAWSWINALTHFEVLTLRRKRSRTREAHAGDVDWAESGATSVEDALIRLECKLLVQRALDALPVADRRALEDARASAERPAPSTPQERKRKQRALNRLQAAVHALSLRRQAPDPRR